MIDPTTVAHEYLALWNDGDGASRRDRLSRRWVADALYVDPVMAGHGHDGLQAMIAGARQQFPDHTFSLRGTPDGHGPFVRFSWTLAQADGAVVANGTDIVRLDEQSRIVEVVGFLDQDAA